MTWNSSQPTKLEYRDMFNIKYGVLIQNYTQEIMYNTFIILKQFIHRCGFMKCLALFSVYNIFINSFINFFKQ